MNCKAIALSSAPSTVAISPIRGWPPANGCDLYPALEVAHLAALKDVQGCQSALLLSLHFQNGQKGVGISEASQEEVGGGFAGSLKTILYNML